MDHGDLWIWYIPLFDFPSLSSALLKFVILAFSVMEGLGCYLIAYLVSIYPSRIPRLLDSL